MRGYGLLLLGTFALAASPALADQKNFFTWFRGGESTVIGKAGDALSQYYPFGLEDSQCATLPPPLAELIFTKFGTGDPKFHLPREDIFRCYGELSPDQYRFRLVLVDGGIGFVLPLTRNYSCGEEIRVTFEELAPFMNNEGLRYVSQIKKSRKARR